MTTEYQRWARSFSYSTLGLRSEIDTVTVTQTAPPPPSSRDSALAVAHHGLGQPLPQMSSCRWPVEWPEHGLASIATQRSNPALRHAHVRQERVELLNERGAARLVGAVADDDAAAVLQRLQHPPCQHRSGRWKVEHVGRDDHVRRGQARICVAKVEHGRLDHPRAVARPR